MADRTHTRTAEDRPALLERLTQFGVTPEARSQADFVGFLQDQVDTVGAAVAALNLSVN